MTNASKYREQRDQVLEELTLQENMNAALSEWAHDAMTALNLMREAVKAERNAQVLRDAEALVEKLEEKFPLIS